MDQTFSSSMMPVVRPFSARRANQRCSWWMDVSHRQTCARNRRAPEAGQSPRCILQSASDAGSKLFTRQMRPRRLVKQAVSRCGRFFMAI